MHLNALARIKESHTLKLAHFKMLFAGVWRGGMPLNLKDAEYPHQKRKGPYSQEIVLVLKENSDGS